MANIAYVGDGNVKLIAGGGKLYTGIAASFCRTEKDLDAIIANEDTKNIIRNIVRSGHKAAMEFDNFIFGIEGYARVTEIQLVRKRHASYNIKSGRTNKHGNRSFDVVIPHSIENVTTLRTLNPDNVYLMDEDSQTTGTLNTLINKYIPIEERPVTLYEKLSTTDILNIIEDWYSAGVSANIPEEDLRYMKPQGTEFKAAVMMNAAALRDWALIRLCNRAQTEIRDLCKKMINLSSDAAPVLFDGIGPSCVAYGYCPEDEQCSQMKGRIPTKDEALEILKKNYCPNNK